ncbi:MAG: hypothetical protein LQ343_000587 [Gyalolechia ehrenbergii]|nr:MAG: hypothetical protein LQ343_000587 [Gyalolechia ehrenbergii]
MFPKFSPAPGPASPQPNNSLSDIFSDSPPASPSSTTPCSAEPSDIPRLRSTHVTNGYREGIASSKDQALQPGFDEAYPLGAILGLCVGYILGILEGLCAAYGRGKPESIGIRRDGEKGVDLENSEGEKVLDLLIQARRELKVENLFGKEYLGSDGMFAYEVRGKEEEVTFWDVADQHPVVRKWLGRVRDEVRKTGIQDAEKGFEKGFVGMER